jgi:hypothetical protein
VHRTGQDRPAHRSARQGGSTGGEPKVAWVFGRVVWLFDQLRPCTRTSVALQQSKYATEDRPPSLGPNHCAECPGTLESQMRITNAVAAVIVANYLCSVSTAFGQDAVPGEILQRTTLIKIGNSGGTAFSIEYRGIYYLVTARHVVAGLPRVDAVVQVRHLGEWKSYQVKKIIFPASEDVDIAVMESEEPAPQQYSVAVAGEGEGVTLGQQIWFLGYPFGDLALTSHFQNQELPFIKKGTLSAINGSNPNAVVLYIDGFNNPGFSGGPIIFWDFQKHAYRVLGVVKGYRNDTAKVNVNGQQIDSNILVNSGILIGYSIKHAIEAIEKDLGSKAQ